MKNKMIYFFVYFCLFVSVSSNGLPFSLGVENLSCAVIQKIIPHVKAPKVGLITNQSGVDRSGKRTIDKIKECGVTLKYIFLPEHGVTNVAAGTSVPDSVDAATGISLISLYRHGSGKMISADHMNDIDMLIFDIQDSGMRHYTYISTLLQCMKIAQEYNKPFLVLDRPNPLSGVMEGPLVEKNLMSFISIAPIPLRHGMTIGELAWYFNRYVLEKPAQLHVVTMKGYNRTNGFEKELLTQLSPNLQSLQSCYGYSFLGLLGEVEPFDVGVGTPMAFRMIALPVDHAVSDHFWQHIQTLLSSYGIKSETYSHVHAKSHKQTKGLCLTFDTIKSIKSFELLIDILLLLKKEEIIFSFSAGFDKAVGTDKVKMVIAGTESKDVFFININRELDLFAQKARRSFLYTPAPEHRI